METSVRMTPVWHSPAEALPDTLRTFLPVPRLHRPTHSSATSVFVLPLVLQDEMPVNQAFESNGSHVFPHIGLVHAFSNKALYFHVSYFLLCGCRSPGLLLCLLTNYVTSIVSIMSLCNSRVVIICFRKTSALTCTACRELEKITLC